MKQTYECVFPCIFREAVCRKGTLVTIDSADLKAPGNEALASKSSFRLVSTEPTATATATADSPSDKSARSELRRKLADLKVPSSEKATLAELQALLAKATDPAGSPTP